MTWDFVQLFNIIEALYWSALGIGVGLAYRQRPPPISRTAVSLSITLLIFGLSDAIEVITGAWWKPWWLAMLKITCGVLISLGALQLWRRSAVTPPTEPDSCVAHDDHVSGSRSKSLRSR